MPDKPSSQPYSRIEDDPRFQKFLKDQFPHARDPHNQSIKALEEIDPEVVTIYREHQYNNPANSSFNIAAEEIKAVARIQEEAITHAPAIAPRKVPPAKTGQSSKKPSRAVTTTGQVPISPAKPTPPPTKTSKPEGPRRFVIELKSTQDVDPKKAAKLTKKHNKFVDEMIKSGDISGEISTKKLAEAKIQGLVAEDTRATDFNGAKEFIAKGVPTVELFEYLEKDSDLPEEVKRAMYSSADITESYVNAKQSHIDAFNDIRESKGWPDITIREVAPDYQEFSPDSVIIELKDNVASPIIKRFDAKIEKKFKGKGKEIFNSAIKGSKKLGKLKGKAAKRLGKKALKKTATKAIAKAAGWVAGALGVETGPVAAAIKIAVEKIVEFILNNIKKVVKALAYIGLGLLGLGALVSSPFLIAAGAGTLAVAGVAGGAAAITGTLIALQALLPALFIGIMASIIPTLLAALIITPLVIAAIIFIITTGAYVVPGTTSIYTPGIITSEYVTVEKFAVQENSGNPGPFENVQLPLSIKYTVVVTAKDKEISNLRFSDSCRVTQASGSPPCPTAGPAVADAPAGTTVAPGESYEFSYSRYYTDQFNDSFIFDTITLIFDLKNAQTERANASATVRIGDPPDDCPSDWPLPTSGGSRYYLTQGAYGPYSHVNNSRGQDSEALDISSSWGIYGTDVYATHRGQVQVLTTPGYGKQVRVIATCQGQQYFSLYAHLSAVPASIRSGIIVGKGAKIGEVGSTGMSTGAHLHYEFRYLQPGGADTPTGGRGTSWQKNPPYMMISRDIGLSSPFYVPKDMGRECDSTAACSVGGEAWIP